MILSTPNSSLLTPPSRRDVARRGATLLVTLGILTVLSVMAIAFLVASRLQRQTATHEQNRLAARNYMDAGLHLAMRQVEDALTDPNYTDREVGEGEFLTNQRLAPVGHWFSARYSEPFGLSDDISYQATDVLALPTVVGRPYVNLLTPQVLRLVPPALTNGLQLSASQTPVFRSGWITQDFLPTNAPVEMRLRSKPARIAFTVFNCSGFIDANTFLSGPTAHKLPRVCFSQADVTNWLPVARAEQPNAFAFMESVLDLDDGNQWPFFHLSYDPDPDVYPLHYDCYETCGSVGFNRFGAGPTVNLNIPQAYRAMEALKEQAYYCKFNLNNLTNFVALGVESTDQNAPWFNDAAFRAAWFDPVSALLEIIRHKEPEATLHRWRDSSQLAWAIANFMDDDRIPQVSDFPTDDTLDPDLATRADYVVEDVPLINKVTIFDIFKLGHPGQPNSDAPKKPEYYFNGSTSDFSNRYAVAVELWYPFAPRMPPENTACYVGIYTNGADVVTTTNRPWSANELRDWFNWNNFNSSNSVMRSLFYAWAKAYTNAVGASVGDNPLWQTVTDQGALWFTPAMTNHPSWPVADSNGVFSLTDSPIWQAFYPDTYGIIVTNQSGSVSTNYYTYADETNAYVEMVSDTLQTNRLSGRIGTWSPDSYPILLWQNAATSASFTNVLGGIIDQNGFSVPFLDPLTNQVGAISATPFGVEVAVSNTVSGSVTTLLASAFYLAAPDTNSLTFTLSTNAVLVTIEITPVEPLPMPADLGLALAALFSMLPTNSLASLYTFLQMTPDDFTRNNLWGDLLDFFNQNPSVISTLMPSHQEPTLGYMTEADRHLLWPEAIEDETVVKDQDRDNKLHANEFQGYFWTVYPKQTVTFMEVIDSTPVAAEGAPEPEHQAVTNYHALGMPSFSDSSKRNTIWLRPVVTVNPNGTEATPDPDADPMASDMIVDEALLTYQSDNDVPVWGWTSVTNLCIPDPRHNAYARNWHRFPDGKQWLDSDVLNTTNLNTGVHELPFMHFDAPLSTIGDIGHIYASYSGMRSAETEDADEDDLLRRYRYDTLTFSTRAGAALLDMFTVSPTNGPRRGLVQANTQQAPVIKSLLADVKVGWTNTIDNAADEAGWTPLYNAPDSVNNWSDVYADALTNAPYSMGWRSFADMLPNLSTNRLFSETDVWGGTSDLHPLHDYTEDVLRGLVDKVSFRQNIFVVIVAAQALSPTSTETRPVVLSDQRAAVTVIRDAYTGRWVIQSWEWLTE